MCVQNEYNLLERCDEELLEACSANRVAWVPVFPLGGGGFGSVNVLEDATELRAASALGVTASQLGSRGLPVWNISKRTSQSGISNCQPVSPQNSMPLAQSA